MIKTDAIELQKEDNRKSEIFARYDAQLGEIGWHSIHVDSTLDDVSDLHADRMIGLLGGVKTPRVLEIGAYAHHSTQIVSSRLGGFAVSHDISTASILAGKERAVQRGFTGGILEL